LTDAFAAAAAVGVVLSGFDFVSLFVWLVYLVVKKAAAGYI
jgi:hypothetical protein